MNELERIQEIVNIIAKKVDRSKLYQKKGYRDTDVIIPIEVAEELVDILSDSIRTLKDYQVFDHSLPVPPRRLN